MVFESTGLPKYGALYKAGFNSASLQHKYTGISDVGALAAVRSLIDDRASNGNPC